MGLAVASLPGTMPAAHDANAAGSEPESGFTELFLSHYDDISAAADEHADGELAAAGELLTELDMEPSDEIAERQSAFLASLALLVNRFVEPDSSPAMAGTNTPAGSTASTADAHPAETEIMPGGVTGEDAGTADGLVFEDALSAPADFPEAPANTDAPAFELPSIVEPAASNEDITSAEASAGTGDVQQGAHDNDSVVRSVGNADASEMPATNPGEHQARDGSTEPRTDPSITPHPNQAEAMAPAAFHVDEAAVAQETAPATADPVDLPPAVQQVSEVVLEQVEASGGEAVIRLDPPELGSVLIRVRLSGDAVHVEVSAEQTAAMNLLRENAQALSDLLGDRGLNLADVHVGHGEHGQQHGSHELSPWASRRRAGNNEFAKLLGIEEPTAARAHNRLQAAYNPDGRHIYRI